MSISRLAYNIIAMERVKFCILFFKNDLVIVPNIYVKRTKAFF